MTANSWLVILKRSRIDFLRNHQTQDQQLASNHRADSSHAVLLVWIVISAMGLGCCFGVRLHRQGLGKMDNDRY